MKLARILYFYFISALIIVLTIFGYLSYHREALQLEADIFHDLSILGQTISATVPDVWKSGGRDQAMAVLRNANNDKFHISANWLWLSNNDSQALLQLAPNQFNALYTGKPVYHNGILPDGRPALMAYFPVQIGFRHGVITLSEPINLMQEQARINAIRLAGVAIILIILIGFLMAIKGHLLVGLRMRNLVAFAGRIGKGELEQKIPLTGDDEITELSHEMNKMADQLARTRQELISESEARIATLEQLRHSERLATLGRLSSGMAHELGTPLNVISGRAKLIATENMDHDETVENAVIVGQQAERMTTIMRQVLDYARRKPLNSQPSDLLQLVKQVFAMLENSAEKHNIELKISCPEQLPKIVVDFSKMQQVLTNIILNAIQAMPGGGLIMVTINKIHSRPQSDITDKKRKYIVVSIQDSGTGISPTDLSSIFEPFFTTKEIGKGTGLGLSVAQGIMEEHQGWIQVESKVGVGSCFKIHLPMEV